MFSVDGLWYWAQLACTNFYEFDIYYFVCFQEYMLRAEFRLPSITSEESAPERKAPIRVKFEIPYFTVSGIQVSLKWVYVYVFLFFNCYNLDAMLIFCMNNIHLVFIWYSLQVSRFVSSSYKGCETHVTWRGEERGSYCGRMWAFERTGLNVCVFNFVQL